MTSAYQTPPMVQSGRPPTASVCQGGGVKLPPKEASMEQATTIGGAARDQSLPPRLTSDEVRHHLAGRRPPRCLCPWVRHATRLGSDLRGDSFGTSSSTATSA